MQSALIPAISVPSYAHRVSHFVAFCCPHTHTHTQNNAGSHTRCIQRLLKHSDRESKEKLEWERQRVTEEERRCLQALRLHTESSSVWAYVISTSPWAGRTKSENSVCRETEMLCSNTNCLWHTGGGGKHWYGELRCANMLTQDLSDKQKATTADKDTIHSSINVIYHQ